MGLKSSKDEWLQGVVDEYLDEISEELKGVMQDIIHVDTGNLRDSITVEKKYKSRFVGVDADKLESDSRNESGVDYSPYYYHGNQHWGGHKFLEEAMNRID